MEGSTTQRAATSIFHQVVLLDLMEESGQEACRELRKKYGDDRVVFYRCDVTCEEDLVSMLILPGIQARICFNFCICSDLLSSEQWENMASWTL